MRKTIKAALAVGVALLLVMTFVTGCQKAAKKNFTIAFMPGIADPFYFTMERGIKAKAKELGVNVVVGDYPATWGPAAQMPNLDALMAKGNVDLLLIAPTSTTALVAPLKKIYDKGIPVITVDTYLGDGDYSKASDYNFPLAFIGTDNKLGGKQVAEQLAKMIGGKGKVYVVNTNPDTSSVVDRGNGFKEGIAEFPNIKLVGMDWCMDVQQTSSSRGSSGTSGEHLRAPWNARRASSSSLTAGRSSWTKSAICPSRSRRSSCGCWRNPVSKDSAG
jgi:ribose transport system substrate-binding protein